MSALYSRFRSIIERRYKDCLWRMNVKRAINKEQTIKDQIVVFDTAIGSKNMGDYIIQYYCRKVLDELFFEKKRMCVSTHIMPSEEDIQSIIDSKIKIVCGTNLITPHYEEFSNWKMSEHLYGYKNVIAMGVGWGYYCDDISKTSRFVYNSIFSKEYIHSVRDSYTEQKFKEMEITNVINTGCPTLWNLSPERCEKIPTRKAKNVICTITDYDRDYLRDKRILEILLKNYDTVAVWIQGVDDQEYLDKLIDIKQLTIIPGTLDAYTDYLRQNNLDYVGTRLHAGIHALNNGVRSIIIAIDNRAIEMGRDFGLPIILRNDLDEELEEMINKKLEIDIKIPQENIIKWKKQFAIIKESIK